MKGEVVRALRRQLRECFADASQESIIDAEPELRERGLEAALGEDQASPGSERLFGVFAHENAWLPSNARAQLQGNQIRVRAKPAPIKSSLVSFSVRWMARIQ